MPKMSEGERGDALCDRGGNKKKHTDKFSPKKLYGKIRYPGKNVCFSGKPRNEGISHPVFNRRGGEWKTFALSKRVIRHRGPI